MVHGRIVPLVGQHLRLRRVRIIARALHQAAGDFDESLARAERDGRSGAEQQLWILITGLILRGERQRDGRPQQLGDEETAPTHRPAGCDGTCSRTPLW